MERRISRRLGGYGAAIALAMLINGCALTAMIQVTPEIGTPGQPQTFTVKVTNVASCTMTTPALIFLPLITRTAEVDQICSIAQSPALFLCENVEDPSSLPQEIIAACCADSMFAMNNPSLCSGATFGNPPQGLVQDVESFVSNHSVTSTALVTAPGNPGAAVTCNFNGVFFTCLLDDLPAGQSETATFMVTPTMGGSFANFVFAGGSLTCDSSLIPFGSTCADTTVTAAAPAPTLSHGGIAASLILLAMIAGWRMRALRRRKSRPI